MHRRTTIASTALAGLAAGAHAQTTSVGSVSLTASATTVSVSDTFTIGVVVDDNGQSANGVVFFDILVAGDGAAFTPIPDSLAYHPLIFVGGDGFTPDGAHAAGAHQHFFGPSIEPPLNGLAVFTFQLAADQPGQITFGASDGPFQESALRSIVFGAVTVPQEYHEIVFDGVTVNVIPPPPGAALLALTAPALARRRRR